MVLGRDCDVGVPLAAHWASGGRTLGYWVTDLLLLCETDVVDIEAASGAICVDPDVRYAAQVGQPVLVGIVHVLDVQGDRYPVPSTARRIIAVVVVVDVHVRLVVIALGPVDVEYVVVRGVVVAPPPEGEVVELGQVRGFFEDVLRSVSVVSSAYPDGVVAAEHLVGLQVGLSVLGIVISPVLIIIIRLPFSREVSIGGQALA